MAVGWRWPVPDDGSNTLWRALHGVGNAGLPMLWGFVPLFTPFLLLPPVSLATIPV